MKYHLKLKSGYGIFRPRMGMNFATTTETRMLKPVLLETFFVTTLESRKLGRQSRRSRQFNALRTLRRPREGIRHPLTLPIHQ
jgi:hypothetical protein